MRGGGRWRWAERDWLTAAIKSLGEAHNTKRNKICNNKKIIRKYNQSFLIKFFHKSYLNI
jgi:hypothetical protein